MQRLFSWQIVTGISLLLLSGAFYLADFLLFHNSRYIFQYLISEIAFIPIQVLIVTLIINELLKNRDKYSRLQKLNMVIGVFFSEVGTELLTYFSDLDPNLDKIKKSLMIKHDWTNKEFDEVAKKLKQHAYSIQINKVDLNGLKHFLHGKRDFLLRLLENPNLLEHETFTDLLQAVFHLTEELVTRKECSSLKEKDCSHIENDITRAYSLLVIEWLSYMKHLKDNYSFLFSLAMRINPFDETASPFVQ